MTEMYLNYIIVFSRGKEINLIRGIFLYARFIKDFFLVQAVIK